MFNEVDCDRTDLGAFDTQSQGLCTFRADILSMVIVCLIRAKASSTNGFEWTQAVFDLCPSRSPSRHWLGGDVVALAVELPVAEDDEPLQVFSFKGFCDSDEAQKIPC